MNQSFGWLITRRMKLSNKHNADDEDWYFCIVITNFKFNRQPFIILNRALLIVEYQSQFYKLAEVQLKPLINMCTSAWKCLPWEHSIENNGRITNLCSVNLSFYYITATLELILRNYSKAVYNIIPPHIMYVSGSLGLWSMW